MEAYYIIDNNGLYIETVYLIKQDGIDYTNYIEIEPNWNLIQPKWNGLEWIEGYTEPMATNLTEIIEESNVSEV